jgi:putative ABC transport system permease protein
MSDIRLAARTLCATPVVTVVAVLSLVLGIGANTAIFSLVDGLVLRPLPVPHPDRLVGLSVGGESIERSNFSYATFDRIRRHADAFEGALAFSNCCSVSTMTIGTERSTAVHLFVSGDFFSTLGLRPAAGRFLTTADDEPGGGADGPVAVISYRLWRERFAARTDIAGTRVVIDRVPMTIVGVAPPEFRGMEIGRTIDVLLPAKLEPLVLASTPFDDTTAWLNVMLRLKSGVSREAGEASLRAAQPQIRDGSLPRQFRPEFLRAPFTLTALGGGLSTLRGRFERPLLALLIVAAAVLLVACANIANLQIARGAARRHELSVRLALGATRWDLARQLLAESVLLGGSGSLLGFGFARWASRAIVAEISPASAPVALDLSSDWRVLAFTATTMVAAVLLFGTAPALRAGRVPPIEALRQHGRDAGAGRWTGALVVAQVALSLVLVVVAGLFVSTFAQLTRVPLGLERDRTTVIALTAPTVPAAARNAFYHRLIRALADVPGVAHVGGTINPPLIGTLHGDLVLTRAGERPPRGAPVVSQGADITPDWLASYGSRIREGRGFTDEDVVGSPPVMIVNEAVARQLFPGQPLVGTPVQVTYRSDEFGDIPIGVKIVVGIVEDAVFRSIRSPAQPTIYTPLAQRDDPMLWTYFYITVQSKVGAPALLTQSLTSTLHAINRDLTFTFRPVTDQVNEALAQDRLVAMLSGFFGALALLLAAIGLYGVTSHAVTRRRAEIGIRMSLGATHRAIVGTVVSRVAVLVAVGIGIGLIAAASASRFITSLLYGVAPRDPATLVGACAVLTTVACLATWVPAYRATRVDPAEVLRDNN